MTRPIHIYICLFFCLCVIFLLLNSCLSSVPTKRQRWIIDTFFNWQASTEPPVQLTGWAFGHFGLTVDVNDNHLSLPGIGHDFNTIGSDDWHYFTLIFPPL